MHPNPRRIVPVVIILAVLALILYWVFWVIPASAQNGVLSASGTIESVQIQIAPELSGKVLDVLVSKGDVVKEGDVLLVQDTSLLMTQRAQAAAAVAVAQANATAAQENFSAAQASATAADGAQTAAQAARDAAQANLDLLKAGATVEQLEGAASQAAAAQANYQAAQASYAAMTAGARPEEVAAARQRLELARGVYAELKVTWDSQQMEDMQAAVDQAENNLDRMKGRRTELKNDDRTPPAIEDALPVMEDEADFTLELTRDALKAVKDEDESASRQLEAARGSLNQATQMLSSARARQTALDNTGDITEMAKDALQAAVDDAQDMVDAAQTAYNSLLNSDQAARLRSAWDDVQRAQTDLNAMARGGTVPLETVIYQVDAASASENAAQANYLNLKHGARAEQISAAEAQVKASAGNLQAAQAQLAAAQARANAAKAQAAGAAAQVDGAQAALDGLDVQISKMTIKAPADGVVLLRSIEPGEVATPGGILLTLARPQRTITVYIPEDRFGQIMTGQAAEVTVDSFNGVRFEAKVMYIADKAEFTPRNVQTVSGRKNTVYAVELSVSDPEGKLKPGMPADVIFK